MPWQLVCEQTGAELVVAPINDLGEVELERCWILSTTRRFSFAWRMCRMRSGTVCPVREVVEHARARGIPVLVDGAQGVPHLRIDVQELGCDFYAFSGHKMFGPTGTGVLYGREALLEAMPPWQGGGDMILEVSFDKTIYNELPYKFEAGTPNIAGVIGLGAAIDYLQAIGMQRIADYEHDLHDYMVRELKKVDGIRLIGEAATKPAYSPSCSAIFTRMTSARSSTIRASRFAPGITAPCPSCSASAYPARRARRSRSITTGTMWIAW